MEVKDELGAQLERLVAAAGALEAAAERLREIDVAAVGSREAELEEKLEEAEAVIAALRANAAAGVQVGRKTLAAGGGIADGEDGCGCGDNDRWGAGCGFGELVG